MKRPSHPVTIPATLGLIAGGLVFAAAFLHHQERPDTLRARYEAWVAREEERAERQTLEKSGLRAPEAGSIKAKAARSSAAQVAESVTAGSVSTKPISAHAGARVVDLDAYTEFPAAVAKESELFLKLHEAAFSQLHRYQTPPPFTPEKVDPANRNSKPPEADKPAAARWVIGEGDRRVATTSIPAQTRASSTADPPVGPAQGQSLFRSR